MKSSSAIKEQKMIINFQTQCYLFIIYHQHKITSHFFHESKL